ncbi:MAG: hypothetical protein AAGB22_13590 [Bacteroidota bacterium]
MGTSDRYTKFLLTVIAAALSAQVVQHLNLFSPAMASTSPPVPSGNSCPCLNPDGTLDVNIKSVGYSTVLPVTIKDIDTRETLNINVREVNGYTTSSSSGRLNVRCDD